MERLARAPEAFIRPTPGGSWSGGVARRTREAVLLCEAAGYDLVCVETIGVGQAELAVADLTDCVLLLLLAQAGDELQGIKRGILEVADLVVIHKADGDGLAAAERARDEYDQALRLLRGEPGAPPVLCASARSGHGVEDLATRLLEFGAPARAAARDARRRRQAAAWFDEGLRERLLARLQQQPEFARALAATRAQVEAGTLDPRAGIDRLLGDLTGS
jgi:LAO/AO transport system kinase